MKAEQRFARAEAWREGCGAARAQLERGEALGLLVAERRMLVIGPRRIEPGPVIDQRELPFWHVNGYWVICQWGSRNGGRLVAFNRRSGLIAREEWEPRRAWTWTLSLKSLAIARRCAKEAA